MTLYLAPMEGITRFVYRNALHTLCDGAIHKYYTPFIVPRPKKGMHDRERKDLLPENNEGMSLVPQILTNRSEDFNILAKEIHGLYGYKELNLNVGCPSKTVISSGKGAGFLAHPKELDAFLDRIFDERASMGDVYDISVKTRLGMEDPEEIWNLLEIYGKYPISELTVHVRVQSDYYKKPARKEYMHAIKEVYAGSLVYNGDLFSVEDYAKCTEIQKLPLMLGRGVIRNPFLPCLFLGQELQPAEMQTRLERFHQEIYEGYQKEMDALPAIYHMKELWSYMGDIFQDSGKARKCIRKAKNKSEYMEGVRQMLRLPLDVQKVQELFV